MASNLPGPPIRQDVWDRESDPPPWGHVPAQPSYPYPPPATGARAADVFRALALGAAGLLLITLALGILVALLLVISTLVSTTEAIGGVSGRLDRSFAGLGGAVNATGERLASITDPTRPPTGEVVLDTEIEAFRLVSTGNTIAEADGYRYTLAEIRWRDAATPAEHRQFAVIRRELIQPEGRSLLGIPLPAERGEAEYYVDRGELFQIGDTLYKLNWLSAAQQRAGLIVPRDPDATAGPIEFRSGQVGS